MSAHFRIFDFNLATSFPFQTRLPKSSGEARLTLELVEGSAPALDWKNLEPIFDNSQLTGVEENRIAAYALEGMEAIRIGSSVTFLVRDDVIQCVVDDKRLLWLAELSFLGIVCSFWLERQGMPVLHSSAISMDGHVIGFLGDNGAGKSSLAATFLEGGASFVTDDVLPIESVNGTFVARPSYPSMRLWPIDAQRNSGSSDLERVQPAVDKRRGEVGRDFPGGFNGNSAPLTSLFVIKRSDDAHEIAIDELSPTQSLIELVRNSFIPRLVMAMGWQRHRLDRFVDLLSVVKVKLLVYPNGVKHLPAVREAVLAHVR